MRIKIIPLVGCLVISLVIVEGFAANGGDADHDTTGQCPFGIIEGPDPIGFTDCLGDPKEKGASRDSKSSKNDPILPPGQMQSAHGRPDFGSNAKTGQPFMVWAARNSRERDIAFSSWTDSGWGRVEYVTSSLSDEIDPRAFADADGSVYVAWWTDDVTPAVYVAHRDPAFDGWTAGRRVVGSASRPTVAIVDGRVWVAFEREAKFGLRYVMVANELPDGRFAERIVATSDHNQALGVEIHMDAGRLWLDWKQSRQELGFAEWSDGKWSEATAVPWVDRSWGGEQEARRSIRDLLLLR
jgi:hypothetical protein